MRRVSSVAGFYTPYAHDVVAAGAPDLRLAVCGCVVGVLVSARVMRGLAWASRALTPAGALLLALLAAGALAWRLTWCVVRARGGGALGALRALHFGARQRVARWASQQLSRGRVARLPRRAHSGRRGFNC
jgi:hypothetical protein